MEKTKVCTKSQPSDKKVYLFLARSQDNIFWDKKIGVMDRLVSGNREDLTCSGCQNFVILKKNTQANASRAYLSEVSYKFSK